MYALVDSGASHSLMDEQTYHKMSKQPLQKTDLLLKSVTGEPLDIVGSGEILMQLSPNITMNHSFLVVKTLQPYEGILGLVFSQTLDTIFITISPTICSMFKEVRFDCLMQNMTNHVLRSFP